MTQIPAFYMRYMRFLMVLAVTVLLAACSTTEELVVEEDLSPADREAIAGAEGLEDIGLYSENLNGAAPGTQEDLVVNVGDRIFFGYDRFDLSVDARMILERQAEWLARYPNITVTIEGHADERGTREYNLALGERRANSVRNYLVALGVEPSRVGTISYGKERPAVPGSNESSWTQNRRGVTSLN